jgi:hypothetical protein
MTARVSRHSDAPNALDTTRDAYKQLGSGGGDEVRLLNNEYATGRFTRQHLLKQSSAWGLTNRAAVRSHRKRSACCCGTSSMPASWTSPSTASVENAATSSRCSLRSCSSACKGSCLGTYRAPHRSSARTRTSRCAPLCAPSPVDEASPAAGRGDDRELNIRSAAWQKRARSRT